MTRGGQPDVAAEPGPRQRIPGADREAFGIWWMLWWTLFLPLAWIGMYTVLALFGIGICIALLTRLPIFSGLRLLIPMGNRTKQAAAWVRAVAADYAPNWKPSMTEVAHWKPGGLTFIDLSGGRCRYILDLPTGTAKGTVLLLHGVSMTCDMWAAQAAALRAEGYKVIRFDFFGHGFSDCNPRREYDLETFLQQTEEVAGKLCGDSSPTLVGFSLGGLVAAAYTARHPQRVSRLCLVDSCGFAAPCFPMSCFPAYLCRGIYAAVRTNPIRWLSSLSGSALLRLFGWAYPVTHEDVLQALEAIRHFDSGLGVTYASLWLLLITWSFQMRVADRGPVYFQFLKNFNPFGTFSSAIQCIGVAFKGPVLLVWGDKDTLVPLHTCSKWQEAIPSANLVTIKGADHNVPLQRPEELQEVFVALQG